MRTRHVAHVATLAFLALLPSCAEEPGSVPEVPAEELAAEVTELGAVHDVMQPIWHEAWPARDFSAIGEAVPDFESAIVALDAATLPGILQDKQAAWDTGKARLLETFESLKAAVESGNEDEILLYTEAFHGNYEGLVRLIRPVVPEVDTFHQALYGVVHYYGPGYDLEKIGQATEAMAAAIPPLEAVQLPARVEEHQAAFEAAVTALGQEVTALQAAMENPSRAGVEAAIDRVHTAYGTLEEIFG